MITQQFLVPRELLEELLEAMQPMYSLPAQYYGSTLGERVRALLAQPSDGALTNEGAEPVAYIDPAHLETMGKTATGSASCVIFNSSQGGCLKPLYSDPPAPASVVLPSLEDFQACVIAKYGFPSYQLCLLDGKDLQNIWVACTDRVKELNS